MSVRVAVAKRRSKRVAGAAVHFAKELGWWQLILYTIVNEKVAPLGINHFASQEEAITDANDVLKVTADDWADVPEENAERYILDYATNHWSPAEDAKRRGRGGPASAPNRTSRWTSGRE